MAATYTQIASVRNISTADIVFSNIPSTYTELFLTIQGTTSTLVSSNMSFNGITTATYGWGRLYHTGAANTNLDMTTGTGSGVMLTGAIDTGLTSIEIWIPGYKDTNNRKGYISKAYIQNSWTGLWWGSSQITAAINSITLSGAVTYQSGTVATLYGVLA